MCYICNSYPCDSRCPNAQNPAGFGKCKVCGEAIFSGDSYAEIDGQMYHEDCLDALTVSDWLDMLGESIQIAEVDY